MLLLCETDLGSDLEVEQISGVITHGLGDAATTEKCTILRLVGSKATAMEGFLAKLQVPSSARETVPLTSSEH